MAKGKSTVATQIRPFSPNPAATKSAEALRAKALREAKLREFSGPRVRRAIGLLQQLRDAGWIPSDVAVDESVRVAIEWTDANGRRCVLRPYGGLQWEAVRYLLPEERAQAMAERRQAEAEAGRQAALERERREQARQATASTGWSRPSSMKVVARSDEMRALRDASPAKFNVGEAAWCDCGDEWVLVEIVGGYDLYRVASSDGAHIDESGRFDWAFGYVVKAPGEKEVFVLAHQLLDRDNRARHVRLVANSAAAS
ncbi:MAG: hypothetical protein ACOY5V_13290 [Pseudomonadota bacterium]|jgi:hypothetical protein